MHLKKALFLFVYIFLTQISLLFATEVIILIYMFKPPHIVVHFMQIFMHKLSIFIFS